MANNMPHQRWLESCGELALIGWYVCSYGLLEYDAVVRRIQEVLESDRKPYIAGGCLVQLLEQMHADTTLNSRIASAAIGLGDGDALVRQISALAALLLQYSAVDDPEREVALSSSPG